MPLPTPTPSEPIKISIDGADADIWSWQALLHGKMSCKECPTIQIDQNGQRLDASQTGNSFSAELTIKSGENKITAVAGSARSQTVVCTGKLEDRPVARITPSIENGLLVLDSQKSEPAHSGAAVQEAAWSARLSNPAGVSVSSSLAGALQPLDAELAAQTIWVSPPAVDGEYYFALKVKDADGSVDTGQVYAVIENGAWRIPDYATENPAFVENTVVYGVIPRKFGKLGFHSIIERLDELKDLGINALWLSPVFVSPPGNYGYAVMDYFNLAPNKGSKEDFHLLIQEAHARGIRILMDFVPNHSSDRHPYYQDMLKYGQESSYWDFYDHDETGAVTHYFDWTNLPNLNYSNPAVRRWITEAFSYWVREFDVDGFRVDACWGVKQRWPECWPEWRRELQRIKPDLLLLAEASARDSYYFDNGFDAAYDWTDQLGKWAWEKIWEDENLITYNLNSVLTNNRKGFHPDALIFRFLNNNDTNIRFIATYGPELTRVATALLLTLPGLPCVYTGDEYGEAYRPYYDTEPLDWKEQVAGLREYHKKLITLRKEIPSLHSRHWQILDLEPHQQIFGYLRCLEDKTRPVLVLLNFLAKDAGLEIKLPEEFEILAQRATLRDALTGKNIPVQYTDTLRLQMPGMQALVLLPGA